MLKQLRTTIDLLLESLRQIPLLIQESPLRLEALRLIIGLRS